MRFLENCNSPFQICEDNAAALIIATTGRQKPRTKHIGLRHFWMHEKINTGRYEILKVTTDDMLADIFSKILDRTKFCALRPRIGVVDVSEP